MRSENWTITLYPENKQDIIILDYIKKNYYYAYITHNKDITENGELKKEHIHIIIFLENARTIESISKELKIEQNRIEKVKNIRKMVRYLIHLDNKEKYQYKMEEINSNNWNKIENYFINEQETMQIKDILEFIYSKDEYMYYSDVLEYTIKNNYYASYRRGASIINKILEEHNRLYLERKESKKAKIEQEKKEREKALKQWEYEKQRKKDRAKE